MEHSTDRNTLGHLIRTIAATGALGAASLATLASAQEGLRTDRYVAPLPESAYLEGFSSYEKNGFDGLMFARDGGADFIATGPVEVSEYLSIPEGSGIRVIRSDYDDMHSNISPEGRVSYLVEVPWGIESITVRQGEDSGPTISPQWDVEDSLGASAVERGEDGSPRAWFAYVSVNAGPPTFNSIEANYRDEK